MQNNKKTIILVIAILLLIIFGIIGLVVSNSNSSGKMPNGTDATSTNTDNGRTENNVTEASDETAVTGSIFDLLKLGNTSKCTFTSNSESVSTSGTTYLSGKQVRGDFDIVSEGTRIESHMYSDGEWVYTWSSVLPQGIKMKIDSVNSDLTEQDSQQVKGMEDFQNKFDYKCSKWSADSSIFVLPEGVQFTDFSETLKDLQMGETNMCAACNMISDETAMAECKSRLGCN